jgi:hypothetical protein
MNRDLYNMINADVVENQQIQKRTGISPARDKWAIANNKPHSGRQVLVFNVTWKNGWCIKVSREAKQDFWHLQDLGQYELWREGHIDFNTATHWFYPAPIAYFVAFKYYVKRRLNQFMHYCLREESLMDLHEQKLKESYQDGFKAGREFEFKTMMEHERNLPKKV